MKYTDVASERRLARIPHEIAMVNLVVFNLLLCAGVIASTLARTGSVLENYKTWLILAPLTVSLALIAYSFRRIKQMPAATPWFVAAHWWLATRRYRALLLAYLVTAVLIALGWLLSLASPNVQAVMFVALVRVAVAPLLVSVMVIAVLESSALFQAATGEVPDRLPEQFPPPERSHL
jgi:hypothetical protein